MADCDHQPELPQTSHYVPAPPTQAKLDYADLPILDLSLFPSPSGRATLVTLVKQAMEQHGFFYVVNHGYTIEQTERMFDIADVPFAHVSEEEKKVYEGKMKETGSYQGYKPRQYWHIDGGVRDQLEHYNINRDISKREHPQPLRPFLPEIEAFAKHNHFNVLYPLLVLLSLGLELPDDTFVKMHNYDAVGETYVRFMKYYPRSEEDEVKTKNVWLKGHTDFGTITILYSQPVAALQILTKTGDWKWVRHVENALVINAGDALQFLSGGVYPATIHRVVQPPPDQRNCTRVGLFYFCMTDDAVNLSPLIDSPVLQRAGVKEPGQNEPVPTMEEWRRGRTAAYGQTSLVNVGNNVEEEVINGRVVKHYN